MVLIVSEKQGPHGLLLVITDKGILGNVFEEGRKQLDLRKEFYKGEEKSKEQIKIMCSGARDVHLTGKEAVALGVELGLVDAERILWVKGVPHAEAAF